MFTRSAPLPSWRVPCSSLPAPLHAQAPLPPVTLGAGLQTSFVHTSPKVGKSTDAFLLNSARLYVNGLVTDKIKFMFNSEYDGKQQQNRRPRCGGAFRNVTQIQHLGRALSSTERRANLYGPYYSNEWPCTTDGIQDGYPFVFQSPINHALASQVTVRGHLSTANSRRDAAD